MLVVGFASSLDSEMAAGLLYVVCVPGGGGLWYLVVVLVVVSCTSSVCLEVVLVPRGGAGGGLLYVVCVPGGGLGYLVSTLRSSETSRTISATVNLMSTYLVIRKTYLCCYILGLCYKCVRNLDGKWLLI